MNDMFKYSMAKGKDDILKNGAGADDVRNFLKGVVKAKGGDEKAQLACWGRKATGEMVADYAIGLVIDEGKSMLYDNGITSGRKDFTMNKMAGRMIDISACFVFDLFE